MITNTIFCKIPLVIKLKGERNTTIFSSGSERGEIGSSGSPSLSMEWWRPRGGAILTARKLAKLLEEDRGAIRKVGRSAGSALRVHRVLERVPIISIAKTAAASKMSIPTATASLGVLQKLKLVREVTGKKRSRLFAYERYLKLLSEGTEPL